VVCQRYYLRRAVELKMDSRVIAELILHLGRIASREALVEGLTPAQWAVLRYFARANRFSRTPSAFAAFHGTTRGTASQTIKNLETQGYLTRMRSDADGRSTRLDLTDKARAILVNDSFEALVRAADALPPGVRGHFVSTLQRMLHQVARERGASTFGTCTSCEHLEGDGCSREGQAPYACGFMSEALLLEELDEVCINFVPGKPMTVTDSVTGAAPR
jgi:DNA-binding MarR family transcriptional regulator